MAQFPALPLFTDAYLGDTTHLTCLEHGAYLLLLMAMWRSPECRLPADDKLLARYAHLTAGQWERIRPTIMAFFRVEDSYVTQGRLTDEHDLVRQHSRQQSDKARGRWLKNKNMHDAAALPGECNGNAPLPLPTPTEEKTEAIASVDRTKKVLRNISDDWPADFCEQFWARYPNKVGKPKALARLEAVARRGTVRWADLMAGLEQYIATKPADRAWCNPETWINQERWTDQPAPPTTSRPPPSSAPPRRNAFFDLAEQLRSPDDQHPSDSTFDLPGDRTECRSRGLDEEVVRSAGAVRTRSPVLLDLRAVGAERH